MRRPVADKALRLSTTLRCPACGRWLGEVEGYARLVCSHCGGETTYKSRQERRAALDGGAANR